MSRLLKIISIITITLSGALAGQLASAADTNEFARLLDKAKTYDFSKSRVDLTKIGDIIRQASGTPEIKDIEKQLDEFLKSDATYAAKQFVCRELSEIGTDISVPVLSSMVTDENYSDMSRYALERISGTAVDDALRGALPKVQGNTKIGILNSIGVRGDRKAVGQLKEMISDSNQMVAVAAIAALGRIDDPAATDALVKARDKATGELKIKIDDACLQQADRLAASGQKEMALVIYKQLYGAGEPMPVREAGLRGMILASGDKTGEVVTEALKSQDKAIQTTAIETLRDVAKTSAVKAAAEQLPNLAPAQQIQLLYAFGDCKDKSVMPAVLNTAKSSEETVRVAAYGTIQALGDACNVDMLVEKAASTKGMEQKAAQESLYKLSGKDVDETILKGLAAAETKSKIELIKSCDQRNMSSAVPELMKTAKDADRQVRLESIKALRNLAGMQDMGGLVDLLVSADPADRDELEKTVVAVAKNIPADKNPAQTVLAALPNAKDADTKSSLMSVIGKIGDPAGLAVLKEAINDKDEKIRDAAVRGLSDWPTPAPAEDLLKIAKTSDNQVQKILALRGYVRLIGLINDKPAEEVIKMYKESMTLAPDTSEKRMVLSGLSNLKTVEALQMAGGYLSDSELKQEAEAAVVKIAESTLKKNPQETKDMLQKVLDGSPSETVKDQAEKLLKPR